MTLHSNQTEATISFTRRNFSAFLAFTCFAIAPLIFVYPLALVFADPLLTVRAPAEKADVIVVLGGDGPARAAWAATLWLQGIAPRVLVSGRGDCSSIRQNMMEGGVDADAITVECQSTTTWENAVFSEPILDRMKPLRAVLVTSWFHSRRAIACFKAFTPSVDWISVPVGPTKAYYALVFDPNGIQILKEYPKTIGYELRLLVRSLMQSASLSRPWFEATT